MADDAQEGAARSRWAALAFWLCLALCAGLLLAAVPTRFSVYDVKDDAFMFARYARNLLTHGAVAWNPGGEPTYGLTSLLFLLVVLPIRAACPGSPALVVSAASNLCGLAFVGLFIALLLRQALEPVGRRVVVAFFVFSLAVPALHVSAHFASGMDTTFALAWLTAYLLLVKEHERRDTTRSAAAVGVWGGLTYVARPDLMLFTLAVPAWWVVFGSAGRSRRRAGGILCLTVAVLGLELAAAAWYFGSALPLPFYAKGVHHYAASMRGRYSAVPTEKLLRFFISYQPLVLAILAALLVRFRAFVRRLTAADAALAVAAATFVAYYATMVLQVMPFNQRFYYPVLPVLAWLGSQAVLALAGRPGGPTRRWAGGHAAALAALGLVVVAGFLVPSGLWLRERWAAGQADAHVGRFGLQHGYRAQWDTYWYRLDAFSALPDDLVIATTEIGLPGAMNPRKTIVDLACLNETDFALHGFSADGLFAKYQPDLFYLHPDYAEMNREILTHPQFRRAYEWFPGREVLGTYLGVAICRESEHYAAMRAIVAARAGVDTPAHGGYHPPVVFLPHAGKRR
ncbi:MAG: hypothetical protein ACLF0G_02095 [Candidatus Brocadiia bacterium]